MRIKTIAKIITACTVLSGCNTAETEISPSVISTDGSIVSGSSVSAIEEEDTFSNECLIELGDIVSINGKGAWLDDNCIKISQSGVYTISGKLSDGLIFVETSDTVKLILNNAEIKNEDGAAIISESDKLIINNAEGTENSLKDSKEYTYSLDFESEDKHNSTIYTKGDLIFTGGGTLNIKAKHGDAVTSGGFLSMRKSTVTIDAEDVGLIAENGISAESLTLNITSEKDCIKTGDSESASVSFTDSNLTLSSEGNDGIQAKGPLFINNGMLDIKTGGDINADSELSSKGLKGNGIKLINAEININSTDHAVKSEGTSEFSGGKLTLSSSMGKGITSEGELTVNNTIITVSDASEGIECKNKLTINSGSINIRSHDDGINTGGDEFSGNHALNINGGSVYINADGDGIDSNGDINITGGTVIVFGAVSDANTALDSGDMGGNINISGGTVIAMGSSGMIKTPKSNYLFSHNLNAKENDTISIINSENSEIISVTAPKSAQSVLFSDGTAAEGYKILLNGTEVAPSDAAGMGGRGGKFGFGDKKPFRNDNGGMPAVPENGMIPDGNNVPPDLPEGMGEIPGGERPGGTIPQTPNYPANEL